MSEAEDNGPAKIVADTFALDPVLIADELRTLWQAFSSLDAPMAAFYKLRRQYTRLWHHRSS